MVTATPIQNRLSELFSLLQFLRLYPYNEQRSLTWESKNPDQAIERLKKLLGFIMLRRLKSILHLPERTDIMIPIEFDDQDEAKYNQAKRATIQYLDEIISSEAGGNGYLNAISKINALRMVCNLGFSTDPKVDPVSPRSSSEAQLDAGDFDAANEFIDGDSAEPISTCKICGILITTSPSPGPENCLAQRAASTGPAELIIGKDSTQCWSCLSDSIGTLASSHNRAPMLQLESQLLFNGAREGNQKSSRVFSTKVKALVDDLKIQRQAKKRSV